MSPVDSNNVVSSFWFNEVCIVFKDIKAVSQDEEEEQEESCPSVGTSYSTKTEVVRNRRKPEGPTIKSTIDIR